MTRRRQIAIEPEDTAINKIGSKFSSVILRDAIPRGCKPQTEYPHVCFRSTTGQSVQWAGVKRSWRAKFGTDTREYHVPEEAGKGCLSLSGGDGALDCHTKQPTKAPVINHKHLAPILFGVQKATMGI